MSVTSDKKMLSSLRLTYVKMWQCGVMVVDAVKTSSFQLNSDSFKSHQSRGSDASVYIGLTLETAVLVSFWFR